MWCEVQRGQMWWYEAQCGQMWWCEVQYGQMWWCKVWCEGYGSVRVGAGTGDQNVWVGTH